MRVAVRSWLIRGLILAGVAVLIVLAWLANSWVSPERVRAQLIASLHDQFEDVDVHVGSARMRILGGIAVSDLKLTRRGDPDGKPFLVVPSAVIYHDKEQLNRGRLVIRKVELENPELHLERNEAGVWNLAEVLKPSGPADKPVPTFVATGATLTLVDRSPGGWPELTLSQARFTLLNDPLPILTVEVNGVASGFGSVQARVQTNRISKQSAVRLTLGELPVSSAIAAVGRGAPELAAHLKGLSGVASANAELTYTPDASPAWRHDVRIDLTNGRLEHPELPHTVEQLALKLRSVDGHLRVEEAKGKLGPAQVSLTLETRADAVSREPKASAEPICEQLERQLQKLDLSVTGVPLDDALFTRMGERGARMKKIFSPTGTADFGYKFTREAAGWKREFEMRPRSLAIVYEKFKYPATDVRGWVKRTVTHTGQDITLIDIRATAGGQVTVKGQIAGTGDDPAMSLRVTGTDVPLDDKFYAALPGKYPALIRQFHLSGRGDFIAEVSQLPGVNLCENEFRVDIRDGTLNYEQFPYPFQKVKGRVVVRSQATDPERPIRPGEERVPLPDKDELILDGFTGVHAGATIWLHGTKRAIPGTPDRLLSLHIGGQHCPLDADLRKALSELKLESVWTTLSPKGRLTFGADVEVMDRGPSPSRPEFDPPFDSASDLKLTFNFSGPTITPSFFKYEMTDLAGWLEYRNGRLDLAHFTAHHGPTVVKLAAGDVRFYPDGAAWANLGGLEMKPFVTDAAFLNALPGKLKSGFEELKLKGGADLTVRHLVVLTPPDGPVLPPPEPLPVGPRAGRVVDVNPLLASRYEPFSLNRGLMPPARQEQYVMRAQAPVASAPPRPTPKELPPSPLIPKSFEQPDPVIYWDAELTLAGASIDTGVEWDELYGMLASRGRYEGTHLGLVRGNLWLDHAVIARQPVSAAKVHIRALPQKPDPGRPGEFLPVELEFADVAGTLFHGSLGGEARVVLAEPTRYEVWLTATDVSLEEVARHYKLGSDADLKGIAQAQVRLYNRLDTRTNQWTVEGAGKIDVPTGRMYNLPILLDLVKVFKWQVPDKTAFEEAHAIFRIQGDRIKVDQLDLIGNAVCLGGSGEVDTSGEFVRFEFYTIWSKMLKQMINTPVGDLTAFLSKNLFKIKMTRENGELRYRPEPIPAVTEPAKLVAERLKNRAAKTMPK
jgi:hypothetical protein